MGFARPISPGDSHVIAGEVFAWAVGDMARPRRWMIVSVSFSDLLRHFFVEVYEHGSGRGFQRDEIANHVRNLRKDMKNDRFTPTPMVAGLLPYHVKHLEEVNGKTHIKINKNNKLPLIDGSQRLAAMKAELEAARKSGDKDREAILLHTAVPVMIHLDHERLKENFLNHQKGRAVDKNKMKAMEKDAGLLGVDIEVV